MCTKVRFSSNALAIQRLDEIKTRGEKRNIQPLRVYGCNECGGYHLTSKELQKPTKFKKKILALKKGVRLQRISEYWEKRFK